MHTALIIFWSGSMVSWFTQSKGLNYLIFFEKNLCMSKNLIFSKQGFILLPHLATLAYSIGPGGEITDIYSYFVSSALHLICSGILGLRKPKESLHRGLGGIYHAIFGPERLEETTYGFVFAYEWQDRFRITAILGAHSLHIYRYSWNSSIIVIYERCFFRWSL